MDDSDTAHQVNIEPSLETTAEVSHESPLYAETLFILDHYQSQIR